MTEAYYANCCVLIAGFNHRMMRGPALNEFEVLLYEQMCRLIESTSRGLRLSSWDKIYPKDNEERSDV